MYGLKKVRNRRDDALARMPWEAMESLVADCFRGQGFEVEHTGTANTRGRTDGGIDLKLRRGDQHLVVECKHWNAYQVPHNDVHELLGIMASERATGAIFVTSGEFTDAARRRVAEVSAIELIDGTALRTMLGPLPEPASSAGDATSATGGFANAGALDPSAHAWTSTRDAPPPRRSPPTKPGQGQDDGIALLLKFAFALVMLWFGKQFLDNMTRNLAAPSSAIVAAVPETIAAPSAPTATDAISAPVAQPKTARESQPRPAMSAAEQRKWERENAEAMRLLEANTPEM